MSKLLPDNFVLTQRSDIQSFYDILLHTDITSVAGLQQRLVQQDEIDTYLTEQGAWRYIRHSQHTDDETITAAYMDWIEHIQPQRMTTNDLLSRKRIQCPFVEELDESYDILVRSTRRQIELYREKNIPLMIEVDALNTRYDALIGKMIITQGGKELTMQQASKQLEETDRGLRKTTRQQMMEQRYHISDEIDDILDQMIQMRQQIATQSGYEHFAAYQFDAYGRFDYTQSDVDKFHTGIQQIVVPMLSRLHRERKIGLGVDSLQPRDKEVDIHGGSPLRPFQRTDELISQTLTCLRAIHPLFAEQLSQMQAAGLLDLESRKHKAAGGYNCELPETGMPFIFMNASGTMSDVTTMVHECGHAMHNFAMNALTPHRHRAIPMEVAEVASMSMELFALPHIAAFGLNEEEIQRYLPTKLHKIIDTLCWISLIDSFQYRLYTTSHDRRMRKQKRSDLHRSYYPEIDPSATPQYEGIAWQKQGHIFEFPFYYIEYGIAQLAALQMWKNYRADPAATIIQYQEFLKCGYTQIIPEIYRRGGIKFALDQDAICEALEVVTEVLGWT